MKAVSEKLQFVREQVFFQLHPVYYLSLFLLAYVMLQEQHLSLFML